MRSQTLSHRAVSSLCLELSLFLHAGAPLSSALSLLAEQTAQSSLKKAFETMAAKINAGSSAGQVFEASGLFPRDVCQMLRVGEQMGKSEETLLSLSRYYDSLDRADNQIRSAMLWPSVLTTVMMTVAVLLLVYVLPIFEQVYASLGGELTGIALVLLQAGHFLRSILPLLCLLLGAILAMLAAFASSQRIRSLLFGIGSARTSGLNAKLTSARFAHALSLTLAGGLHFEAAVETAGTLLPSPKSRQACLLCCQKIAAGGDISLALQESGLLPPAECRLLFLGVRGGAADLTSREIAARMERTGSEALENAVNRTEPILVLLCCAIIGLILLSVMLPLAEIMASIG